MRFATEGDMGGVVNVLRHGGEFITSSEESIKNYIEW
ncbi:MAG: hypothetical protein HeimC3_38590 [Candidatus Heimdallarchaeota archaeon LC_3]|nr:MAG: hypothetical protein HeimC3_38590 [Candidatus Heimdallarchaeota archaeon LC_3]